MTRPTTAVPRVWLLSISLLSIGLIAAGTAYLLQQGGESPVEMAQPNRNCDLHQGPCSVEFDDGGMVELTVSPRPIKAAAPLKLSVMIRGIEADDVQVDFSGEGMAMGFNRPRLTAAGESGTFTGEGVLSICATNRMFWRAVVLLNTDRGVMAAPYRFETIRN